MTALEAFVYCFAAMWVAWGLRGMRLVEFNSQGPHAKYHTEENSSGAMRGFFTLRDERKE